MYENENEQFYGDDFPTFTHKIKIAHALDPINFNPLFNYLRRGRISNAKEWSRISIE